MARNQPRRTFLAGAGAALLGGVAGCATPPSANQSSEIDDGPPVDESGTPSTDGPYTAVYRETIGSVGLVRVYGGTESQGSGFVFRGDNLVTNHHVVANGSEFEVQFLEGEWSRTTLVGSDPYSDLAVLSLDDRPEYATPLQFVEREPPIGTRVVVLGAPFGLTQSVSAGIVSGQDRPLPSTAGFEIPDGVQTDAAVNPGNSGGPLLDLDGRAVGVINSGGGENIGFAVSAGLCRRVLPALLSDGEYEHPFLGVRLLEVTPRIARANDLDRARGVLVVDVLDDGPAAGVLRGSSRSETADGAELPVGGDVIVAMDGRQTPTRGALSEFLAIEGSPGETVPITVLRDGERTTVELTLGKRPDPPALPRS